MQRRTSRALLAGALLLLAACAHTPPPASGAGFAFALLGDVPYGAREAEELDALIDAVNLDRSVEFVLHAGDVKGGTEPCSDELLRERFAQLQRLRAPLVYTPGDNDWTDCHRAAAGRFLPLERLAFLRALFFGAAQRGARQALAVESQSTLPGYADYVENALFVRDRVVFATLHVVGSANGLLPWTGFDASDSRARPRPDRIREVQQRSAAALAWIEHAFARARSIDAVGVFLLMQANPRFDLPPTHPARQPFEPLLARLREHARAFGKPVVLAHGDFHALIIDRPFAQPGDVAPLPDLTRVQTFGSPQVRWIRVRVDAGLPEVFFFAPQ